MISLGQQEQMRNYFLYFNQELLELGHQGFGREILDNIERLIREFADIIDKTNEQSKNDYERIYNFSAIRMIEDLMSLTTFIRLIANMDRFIFEPRIREAMRFFIGIAFHRWIFESATNDKPCHTD